MRASSTTVDLRWTADAGLHGAASGEGVPWVRAVRAAQHLRKAHGLPKGPLTNEVLEDLLQVKLPLSAEVWKRRDTPVGGFRNGVTGGRTAILVTSNRVTSQRFYLGRLIGCAIASSEAEHFLPVTTSATALQKFERAFAQELLCPWDALDAFTDEHGMDEEGIAEAAEYFQVSEWLVLTTLVNRGKLPRHRLPPVLQ